MFAAEKTAPAAKVTLVRGPRPPAQPIQAGGAADDQRATARQVTSPAGLLFPNNFQHGKRCIGMGAHVVNQTILSA